MLYEGRYGQFLSLTLENKYLRLVMLPDLGGKVVSLQDLSTGYEWLVEARPEDLRVPVPDDAWSAYPTCGWDECFPNIASGEYPCTPWKGLLLPDHGEVWSQPWSWESHSGQLVSKVNGRRYPYQFERAMRLEEKKLVVDYRVMNRGMAPMQSLWSMHPLFKIEEDSLVRLPSLSKFRVDSCNDSAIAHNGEILAWPELAKISGSKAGPDFIKVMPRDRKLAIKLYSLTKSSWVSLHNKSNWLSLRFNPEQVPYLGLWLNYGGWPDEEGSQYHIGLEPCLASADDLSIVYNTGTGVTIQPLTQLQWQVEISCGIS